MKTEVKLGFIAAGTYGFDISAKYLVPAHGITLSQELIENQWLKVNFKKYQTIYSIKSNEGEPKIYIIPLNNLHDFFNSLCEFMQAHQSMFYIEADNLDELLLKLTKERRLTKTEHHHYFGKFSNIFPIPFKKYTALKTKNESMALELAEIERETAQSCLSWLMHAHNFGAQYPDYIAAHDKISELISGIPLNEFENLFNEAKLPFWLMQMKADLESNKSSENKRGNTVFEQVFSISTSNAAVNDRIEGLKKAKLVLLDHPFISSPLMIADYFTGVEQEAHDKLFFENSDSNWLLDALAISPSEIEIKIDYEILQSIVAQANICHYLKQTSALITVNVEITETNKNDLLSVICQILENVQSLKVLDLSNLTLTSSELASVLNLLTKEQLYKFKILNLQNCGLIVNIDKELELFIEKCMDIETIIADGNMLDDGQEEKFKLLIRQGAPVGFLNRQISRENKISWEGNSPLKQYSKEEMFGENGDAYEKGTVLTTEIQVKQSKQDIILEEMATHNNGGSDDLFLDNNHTVICFMIDAVLRRLNSSLSFFKSPKYNPLYSLKNAFSSKSNTETYRALLVEMSDSKGIFEKYGLTNSFKLFINELKKIETVKLRLLEITKSILEEIQTEYCVQLNNAISSIQKLIEEAKYQKTLLLIDDNYSYRTSSTI